MTPSEASELLKHAAVFDNRRPSEAAAIGWSAALHDMPYDQDATAAVARFYGTPDPQQTGQKWIQPHHVRALRTAIRNERLSNSDLALPPADPSDSRSYTEALRAITRRIADGQPSPFRAINGETSPAAEPGTDYRAIRAQWEADRAAERERQRQQREAERRAERLVRDAYAHLMDTPDEARNSYIDAATQLLRPDATREQIILCAADIAGSQETP